MKKSVIQKILRHQKRKLNIKASETRRYVGASVASFTGVIMALSWNDLLQNFIDVLKQSYPLFSLFGGLIVAVLLTIVAIVVGIIFLNSIESNEKKINTSIDASHYWKADFWNRLKTEHLKTRYFSIDELEQRIFNQMNCHNIEYQGNTITFSADDEFHTYNLVLNPINKSEYEQHIENPMPILKTEEAEKKTTKNNQII